MDQNIERESDAEELEDLLTSIEHEGHEKDIVGDDHHIHQLIRRGDRRITHAIGEMIVKRDLLYKEIGEGERGGAGE